VGTFFADVKLLDQMFHKLDLGVEMTLSEFTKHGFPLEITSMYVRNEYQLY